MRAALIPGILVTAVAVGWGAGLIQAMQDHQTAPPVTNIGNVPNASAFVTVSAGAFWPSATEEDEDRTLGRAVLIGYYVKRGLMLDPHLSADEAESHDQLFADRAEFCRGGPEYGAPRLCWTRRDMPWCSVPGEGSLSWYVKYEPEPVGCPARGERP